MYLCPYCNTSSTVEPCQCEGALQAEEELKATEEAKEKQQAGWDRIGEDQASVME